MGPEPCAILAHAPPLPLEPPLGHRGPQRQTGHASGPLLFGVEDGEVLPDDLLGGVPLEPLGARVPARDSPVLVEHVDGVVGDRIHEQPVTAVVPQRVIEGRVVHGVPSALRRDSAKRTGAAKVPGALPGRVIERRCRARQFRPLDPRRRRLRVLRMTRARRGQGVQWR